MAIRAESKTLRSTSEIDGGRERQRDGEEKKLQESRETRLIHANNK